MTPDLAEIRAALAAEIGDADWFQRRKVLRQNAPTWLAQCAAEIERLRATVNGLNAEIDDMPYVNEIQRLLAEVKMSHDDHAFVVDERDAALAEVERLRAVDERLREGIAVVVAERCAALAQLNAACVEIAEWDKRCFATLAERDAARAVIVKMEAETVPIEYLDNYESLIDDLVEQRDAALAEVERLRGIDDTIDRLIAEGDAWRACADQLAADMRGIGDTMALAAYERLRGHP